MRPLSSGGWVPAPLLRVLCSRGTTVTGAWGLGPGVCGSCPSGTFPKPVDKRGAELLYRARDLKRWARNRPRAATGTTDLD